MAGCRVRPAASLEIIRASCAAARAGARPSNVQRPTKGVQRRLVHALADGRVREDRGEEVGLGGFQGHGEGVALDDLGDRPNPPSVRDAEPQRLT